MPEDQNEELGAGFVTEEDEKAALQEKIRELESNIGRQNNLQGQRVASLQEEVQALRRQQIEMNQKAQQREYNARYSSMSPAEQAKEEARQARLELENFKASIQAKEQAEADSQYIRDVQAEAKRQGFNPDDINTSSRTDAILSFNALKRASELKELADLKAQIQGSVTSAVREATGQSKVATGTPALARESKEPKDVTALKNRLLAAQKERNAAKIIQVRKEAYDAGIPL